MQRLAFWTAAGLLVGAVLLRLPSLATPPLDFAAMRQHHSALIARALFLNQHPTAGPAWQRDAANDYVAQATIPEPRIVERLSAALYEATGVERLSLARWFALACWFGGAWCLFAAARRWFGETGGFCTLAVALFLPYTVGASASIQPDTLAFFLMSAALLAWLSETLPAGVVLSMLAVLVRPMTAFWLVPVASVIVWQQKQDKRTSLLKLVGVTALVMAPAIAYMAYRATIDSAIRTRIDATFVPSLWGSPQYWRGWAGLAWRAFGGLFVIAALAPLVARSGRERAWLRAMWIGYAAYGLLFNLHVSTHPYYQTIAMPLVALSVGAVASRLGTMMSPAIAATLPIALAAVLALGAFQSGVLRPSPRADDVRVYAAIGDRVGHSRRAIFLSSDWGVPLRYYGGVAGRYWPARFEIERYRPLGAGGISETSAAARLERFSSDLGGAEFFIVTDLDELSKQPDLEALLATKPVIERAKDFMVYDLR